MNLNFEKGQGLIPVIIQDNLNLQVLMLGYMNEEALAKTEKEKRVTFYSRTKKRLWTKGEESGNFLQVVSIDKDCDQDTLLIKVYPSGPTCHTGTRSCFGPKQEQGFLYELQHTIDRRIKENNEQSYTASIFKKGINKLAQKVGEEAVELVIEAKDENIDLFKNEAADLMFHYLLLLKAKGLKLEDIEATLASRAK